MTKKEKEATMKKMKVLFGVTILVLLLPISVPSFAQPILKIGSFNARTGPSAGFGLNTDKTIDLCAEEWNKKGGVTVQGQKYQIQMIHEDDKLRGEEAVKAANKLIFTDQVKFIVGPMASPCILAGQTVTESNKIVMFCNASAATEILTRDKPYTFSAMLGAPHTSPAFFRAVNKRYPNLKTCAHIAPNQASGWAVAQADNDACDAVGIKNLATEFYESNTQDFTPILTRMIGLKPDFLALAAVPGAYAALIIKQSRELGYKGSFMHSVIFAYDEVGPIAGWENCEGVMSQALAKEGPLCPPAVKEVGAKFAAKYGEAGFASGGFVYNYMNVLLWGIEKANSLDPEKVRKAIEDLGEIDCIQGKGYWGGQEYYGVKHQLFYPILLSEVQNRKLITVAVEQPQEVPLPKKKWW
jgi:branched-chain amino acid transport system substrate-binding protein